MSIPLRQKVPRGFKPLLRRARYKGAYGGRGGAKSHFFAEQLILRGASVPTRAVCIREYQKDLKDSCYQLLVDKIHKYGLEDWYDIQQSEIYGPNGTHIIFRGMQAYNAENIKSLEGYHIAWVEEAQMFSRKSLRMLRPTIRGSDDAEIWFSWNPRYRTDPVDEFMRKHCPEDGIAVAVNWQDNPWFPRVLELERLHDIEHDDEDTYVHIWEGGYGVPRGSILGRWVSQAERDGRINNGVQYDPDGSLIELSSDIGFHDTTSWWFWQRKIGGYSLFHHVQDSGLDAEEWIDRLEQIMGEHPDWRVGRIYLPHDAKTKTFQSRYSAVSQFLDHFGPNTCRIVPISKKADRINAARTIIPKCEFAADACEDGLDALRAWEFEWNDETQVFSREPKHNWASHPSDAYSYGCQVMTLFEAPTEEIAKPKWPHQQTASEVFWPKSENKPVREEWV